MMKLEQMECVLLTCVITYLHSTAAGFNIPSHLYEHDVLINPESPLSQRELINDSIQFYLESLFRDLVQDITREKHVNQRLWDNAAFPYNEATKDDASNLRADLQIDVNPFPGQNDAFIDDAKRSEERPLQSRLLNIVLQEQSINPQPVPKFPPSHTRQKRLRKYSY